MQLNIINSIVSAAELSCPVVGSALHCLATADYADWDTSLWNINATGGRPLFHKKSAWGN